jgi:plastocyanin
VLAALTMVIGLTACGGSAQSGGGAPSAAPAPDTIVIKNCAVEPMTLTVAPGAMITVDNQDGAVHTVTATNKAFDTGNVAGGQKLQLAAPATPGTYPYLCSIHQYMTATLVVR